MGHKLTRRLTPTEVRALARDLITGQVYLAVPGTPGFVSFEAMLAILASGPAWSEVQPWEWDTIGACYERFDKALDRAVNGYPTFFSLRFLHVNDLPYLRDHLTQMEEALA